MNISAVTIPKKIEKKIKGLSKDLGISKQDFLTNAVLYYFETVKKKMELDKELELWEKASDRDLMKLEKGI